MENKYFSSTSTTRFKNLQNLARQPSESDIFKKSFTSFGKLLLGDEKSNPIMSKLIIWICLYEMLIYLI